MFQRFQIENIKKLLKSAFQTEDNILSPFQVRIAK